MNATTATSGGCAHAGCLSPLTKTLVWLAFGCVGVVGVLGNAFVVWAIAPDARLLRVSTNRLLLSLAAADLANVLACAPEVVQALHGAGWLLPAALCPLIRFLGIYSLYASILVQLAIGVERYLAICHPLHVRRLSRASILLALLGACIVAGLMASPYLIYSRTIHLPNGYQICYWWRVRSKAARSMKRWFKTVECTAYYMLPLVVLSALYARMGCALWGRNSLHAESRQARAVLAIRRSVVKMLLLCMLVYFLCYSPIQVLFLSRALFGKSIRVPMWLRLLLNALTLANSAANPVIYTVVSKEFRVKLKLLLRCCSINIGALPGFRFRSATTMGSDIAADAV